VRFLQRHLEDPVRLKRLKLWSYVCLALIAGTEVAVRYVFSTEPAHFRFEEIPAWGSIYGLISCVAIVVLSKLLGKLWLLRRENYYDS
jgi:hypothetical protein